MAQGRTGDALTVADQSPGRYALQRSPRYAWPLLVTGAYACGAGLTSAAAAGDGLADRAQLLLDRLVALAKAGVDSPACRS